MVWRDSAPPLSTLRGLVPPSAGRQVNASESEARYRNG